MRSFYEEWEPFVNRQPLADDLSETTMTKPTAIETNINENLLLAQIRQPLADELSWAEFVRVPFTHHVMILRKEKSIEGRAFYIHQCAEHCWNKYVLRDYLNNNLYKDSGHLPNNFHEAIPNQRLAVRTMKAF